jgi:predicted RND superfamily exporter protein
MSPRFGSFLVAASSRPSIALILALCVVSGWLASSLELDTSMEVWFLDDDPDLVSYRDFLTTFDSDQIVVLAWRDEELWSAPGLAFVHEVTEAAQEVRLDYPEGALRPPGATTYGVQRARSIANLSEIVSQPGMLSVRPLYDAEAPPDPDAFRARILSDERLLGGLVSADAAVVSVVLDVDPLVADAALKIHLASALREFAERMGEQRGVSIAVAGPTMLDDAFFRYTERDMRTIIPAMGLVILLAILVLFRSPRALALPMSVVVLTCLLVTGLMALFGLKLTIIHTTVYPMLLGVGIASSVHVITRATSLRRAGQGPHEATRAALAQLVAPCFFTMATTVAGLLSLLTASLAPVRELGWLGASGVAISFLLTFALGPSLLPLLSAPSPGGSPGSRSLDRMWLAWDRRLQGLGRWVQRRAVGVSITSLLLLLVALMGFTRLQVGSNPLKYFRADDPVRTQMEFVERSLAGTTSLEVLVDTGSRDGLKEPAILNSMVRVQEYLEALPGVGSTISLADYVVDLRGAFRGGAEAERRIPDTRSEVAQLLVLLDDPSELEQWVDFEFSRGRINAPLKMSQAEQLVKEVPGVEALLAREFPPPAKAWATGMSKLISNMEHYLLRSQIRSLALAFVTVLVCMTLALGSLRLGLFSMVPNLLPIGISLGMMGWLGITLDPGTAMTGAVALGLVVDDTVHFLHHFRLRMEAGDDLRAATDHTLRETGRAIGMTSVVLVAGFWLMCLASFVPNIQFGFLCGLAIGLALVANLVVLPAVLVVFWPRVQGR